MIRSTEKRLERRVEKSERPQDGYAQHVPLRLSVSRGTLGLELYESIRQGPLALTALAVSLKNLRFPVDLSGGVQAFRHRRGKLEHMRLELSLDDLARWLKSEWRGALGGALERPLVWRSAHGVRVGVHGDDGALSFELMWAPSEREGRVIVGRTRGGGRVGIALTAALGLVETALKGIASRHGRVFVFSELADTVGRQVLPLVGARAPDASEVRLSALEGTAESVEIQADTNLLPPLVPDETVRALELARLVEDADNALLKGETDVARRLYMAALERAPRHPEIVRQIAEIDVAVGGRLEAALGMVAESLAVTSLGPLGAELLAGSGDLAGARAALQVGIHDEPYAPLAALWCLRLAELEADPRGRLQALDRAVAAAPGLRSARLARIDASAAYGEVAGVLADAEHLEAAAEGVRARHAVLCQAARVLLHHGYVREAGRIFERALRYVPNDASATAGFARSFVELGDYKRAVTLLERATRLAEREGRIEADAQIDLARILAEKLDDLPQAIARIREIAADCPRVLEARALEALWRVRVGDIAGASLAFARLRQQADINPPLDPRQVVAWLEQAAEFEGQVRSDLVAQERHLASALRLAPRDPKVQSAYRRAALAVALKRSSDKDAEGTVGEIAAPSAPTSLPGKDV